MLGNSFRKRVATLAIRSYRAGKPNQSILEADSNKALNTIFHRTGVLLAISVPVAVIASPSPYFCFPFDLALGVLIPLHAHFGMNVVITDYVPKAMRQLARVSVLAMSVITVAGLLKLNMDGPGLTNTILHLWRKPKAEKAEK